MNRGLKMSSRGIGKGLENVHCCGYLKVISYPQLKKHDCYLERHAVSQKRLLQDVRIRYFALSCVDCSGWLMQNRRSHSGLSAMEMSVCPLSAVLSLF